MFSLARKTFRCATRGGLSEPPRTSGYRRTIKSSFEAAILAGASYLGVGPVFPSPTKEFSEPELAGLSFVSFAAENTTLPWFAIGGINEENLDRVLEAGAARIAVSSAVIRAESPRCAAARLKARLIGAEMPPDEDASDREEGESRES